MSQSDQFDNLNGENDVLSGISDPYRSESSEDIYSTPDLFMDRKQDLKEEAPTTVMAKGGAEEAEADRNMEWQAFGDTEEAESPRLPVVEQNGSSEVIPYGSNPQQENAQYNNDNTYGASSQQENGQYNSGSPYGVNMQQGNGQYNSGSPYGTNMQQGNGQYNNGSPYGTNMQQGNGQYNNGSPYGANPQQGNGQYNYGSPYGAGSQGNGQYNSGSFYGANPQQGNTSCNQDPYRGNPQWNNPYSPYAVPEKKNFNGLIIGIVIAVVVLFLIAVAALVYKTVNLLSENDSKRRVHQEYDFEDDDRQVDRYDFDDDGSGTYDGFYDDFFKDYDDLYDPDGFYDDDFYGDDFYWDGQYPFGYDDFDSYDDDYDDGYYNLRDDVKTNLSYSIELENFEYDAGYDNVTIYVTYPVIKGDHVPNLDKLNQTIQAEKDFFTEYFEEEYKDHITEEYSYFNAQSRGYVAYMDEEKMSIVFSEYIYSDYYNDVYLYCINIDMENGIVLNNENLLNINDDFSVEFRQRSDIQNGEIDSLTRMTDQEMTELFNSQDVIVFYTPMGMEIGFNYDEGWVTVTYEDYEKYLKVL